MTSDALAMMIFDRALAIALRAIGLLDFVPSRDVMTQFIRIGSTLVNLSQIRLVFARTHGALGSRSHTLLVGIGGGDPVGIQVKKEEEVAVLRAVGYPGSVEDLANEGGSPAGIVLRGGEAPGADRP